MTYQIRNDLTPPTARPARRVSLDALIDVASSMKVGEAVFLTSSEAQTFRIILAAQGYGCVSDGYRSPPQAYPARTWVFKVSADPKVQELTYEI